MELFNGHKFNERRDNLRASLPQHPQGFKPPEQGGKTSGQTNGGQPRGARLLRGVVGGAAATTPRRTVTKRTN